MSTVGQVEPVARHGSGWALERPHVHEEPQQVHRDRVSLGGEEQRHAHEVDHVGVDQRPALRHQR